MSYKKWVYKYKYLKTEEDEIEELLVEYTAQFKKDFAPIKNTPPTNNEPPSLKEDFINEENPLLDEENQEKPPKKRKDLYKKLSKKLHPDRGGNEDEFKNLTNLYEEEDILGMYVKAEELGLNFILKKEDEETFEITCNNIQEKIEFLKSTAAWKWGTAKEEEKEVLSFIIEQQANVKRRQK